MGLVLGTHRIGVLASLLFCFPAHPAFLALQTLKAEEGHGSVALRVATFNTSLYGDNRGDVAARIADGQDKQARVIAEIIQRVQPDILLLNEFDYDPAGQLLHTFQDKYLAVGQNYSESESAAQPVNFPYHFQGPVNTGFHSGSDLDRNDKIDRHPGTENYGGDSWGFGRFPGQYGMVLLSRFPILKERIRTFQRFKWRDMPGALLPDDLETEATGDWYSAEVLAEFPLSSKSHWDVPIQVGTQVLHILACHPTPPSFDGPEDRNGRRNHDELRFFADYISGVDNDYIYDDLGQRGGIEPGARFLILGDLNGDPSDGQGQEGIRLLLSSPALLQVAAPESKGAVQQAELQAGANRTQRGDSRYDTLDAADRQGPGNLRTDYVLPSRGLKVVASGVFWPENTDSEFQLVGEYPFPGSDHRLVWVDLTWE